MKGESPADEDDWAYHNPQDVVGWITDICLATGWQVSPASIMHTEEECPGLWDDIMLELWQRDLAKKQINPEG